MLKKPRLFKSILAALVILLISISINFLLNISSFEDVYKNTLISRFTQINTELKVRIETGINFGKPIYKFTNIEKYFDEILEKNDQLSNIFVALDNGEVIYSTKKENVGLFLKDSFIEKDVENKPIVNKVKNKYYIYSTILNENLKTEGFVYIEFNEKIIKDQVKQLIFEKSKMFLITLVITFLILIVTLVMMRKKEKNKFVIILILFIVQFIYTVINLNDFTKLYIDLLNSNVKKFSLKIEKEIEYFESLGLKIEKLNKFDEYLSKEIKGGLECEGIMIKNNKDEILYYADLEGNKESVFNNINIENYFKEVDKEYLIEIKKGYGKIILKINETMIKDKKSELLLDSLTMMIISLIIGYQMLLFSSIKIREGVSKKEEKDSKESKYDKKIVIQSLAFLFFFAEMLPLSFIPLYIKKVYSMNPINIFNLPENIILGLPISVYMFGTAISVLVIGFLSDKIGTKKILIWSSIFLISGAVGAGITEDIIRLSIFRLISGIGYGSITITSTKLILNVFKDGKVATGFGFWASGYGAASLCAIPIGGVIVFRFGFFVALMVSAFISILILLFAIKFIQLPKIENLEVDNDETKENIKQGNLNIFTDKNVFANFFLRLIPFHLVYVGIFQFMMPLFMSTKGLSAANIGRVLTIFGLVYLMMPLVSKLVDKMKNDRIFIISGSLLIGSFLILIKFSQSMNMIILIILGISIGSMIADAAEESFITATDKAIELGETKFMSIYNSYERAIMVIAPVVSSLLVAIFGFANSIFIIGVYTIISTIIYIIISFIPGKERIYNEKR